MHHVAGIAPLVTPEPDCGDHEEQREGGDQDEGGHEAKEEGAGESAGTPDPYGLDDDGDGVGCDRA
jgi:hypothetical protein